MLIKKWKKLAVWAMSVVLLFTVFATTASASTSKTFTSAKTGSNKTEFTIKVSNAKSTKISYTCSKGCLVKNGELPKYPGKNCYGYYEVQVWGKNGTKWEPIYTTGQGNHKNIKNVSKGSISVKGYTEYKVAVYAWNTKNFNKTIGSGYGTKSYYLVEDLFTFKYPSITFKW